MLACVSMAQVESVVEPDSLWNAIGWESVALVKEIRGICTAPILIETQIIFWALHDLFYQRSA